MGIFRVRFTLSGALFAAIIIIVLAGVGYLARLNHNDFERIMVKQAQEELLIIAKSEAQSIEGYIGDVDQELEILSSERAIQSTLVEENDIVVRGEYYKFIQDSYKDIGSQVDAIYLIDPNGELVDSYPTEAALTQKDYSKEPDVKRMLKDRKAYTGPVFESLDGKKLISNLHPVFKDGRFAGLLRAVISTDKLAGLIKHVGEGQKRYTVLVDANGLLLSYKDGKLIGKDAASVLKEQFPGYDSAQTKTIISKMTAGQEGAETIRSASGSPLGNGAAALAAFTPIHIGTDTWSIAVVMDYDVIAKPININARDNILFSCFTLAVFAAMGAGYYLAREKRYKSEVSISALNIINKQLRLEIQERKNLERELKDHFFPRNKK